MTLGIFDSGVGGLTVVRAIREILPGLPIRYLGDTARLPYGTKSPSTVVQYALACVERLRAEGPLSGLVVACNTASAHAVEAIRARVGDALPVVGVVEPGARAAVRRSTSGRIGVIATEGTVASGRYQAAISALRADATVIMRAAPLLVLLAEEGYLRGPITDAVLDHHLGPFQEAGIDTLLLGCTHYPLLRPAIEAWLREHDAGVAQVVDSARATAETVRDDLAGGLRLRPDAGLSVLVTDAAERFRRVARSFLGGPVDLNLVDL